MSGASKPGIGWRSNSKGDFHICKPISVSTLLIPALVLTGITVSAQTPTGIISGTVTDASGAVIANAAISLTNKASGIVRNVVTNSPGIFSASALDAGQYEVRAEIAGFRTTVREATVDADNVTRVDLAMPLGDTKEVITVEAATAQINYESHTVAGTIPRDTIQELPINGRGFLQLATLEPGVVMVPGSPSQYNGATFTISIGGGISGRTLIALDGTTMWDAIQGGTEMNFSQEIIQEFQLQSVNYDLSTGITSSGAVNVVTPRPRFYFSDTWKIKPNLTFDYGVAWEYESGLFNKDLTPPAQQLSTPSLMAPTACTRPGPRSTNGSP